MMFLFFLLYALLLWPCAWILPIISVSAGLKTAAVIAGVSSAVGLLFIAWGIDTYQPELKHRFSALARLQGTRAVCFVSAVVIGWLLIAGEPAEGARFLAFPMCFALLLNGLGLDFWPTRLRPGLMPEPTPQPVEPPPEKPGALIVRDFSWTFEEIPYQLRLAIRRKIYDDLRSEERILDPAVWPKTYVSDGITGEVRDLAKRLSRLGKPFGSYDEVSLALAFVQQIVTYTREVGEYPRYPVETLVDEKGDCEDYSILAASILHCMGYQAALMYVPGHAALGVAGAPGLKGTFKEHAGIRYYYCEMTGDGWRIGQLPDAHDASELTVAPIPSPPLKVVRPDSIPERVAAAV